MIPKDLLLKELSNRINMVLQQNRDLREQIIQMKREEKRLSEELQQSQEREIELSQKLHMAQIGLGEDGLDKSAIADFRDYLSGLSGMVAECIEVLNKK